MMKTTQDNYLIDHTGMLYAKNDIELLWPIWLSAVHEENKTRQLCDW